MKTSKIILKLRKGVDNTLCKNNALADKAGYNSIDIVKFVMAVCVIAIHTRPLRFCSNIIINNIYDSFVSSAVPFFSVNRLFIGS